MPILKIKVCDADGKPLTGQTVKITDCEQLTTNADGLTQFLINADATLSVVINGATVWNGASAELKKEEVFSATGSGFARN